LKGDFIGIEKNLGLGENSGVWISGDEVNGVYEGDILI